MSRYVKLSDWQSLLKTVKQEGQNCGHLPLPRAKREYEVNHKRDGSYVKALAFMAGYKGAKHV